jgi:GMP reductase
MLGGMLAGTSECDGEWTYDENNERKSMSFYGMSSKKSQEKYGEGLQCYKASEGRVKTVDYKGTVYLTLRDILGGIRSTCAYIGAKNITEMRDKTQFIRVNTQLNRSLEKYVLHLG